MKQLDELPPLQKAVNLAGGQTQLAVAIGSRQQYVAKWLKVKKIPAEYVIPIEKATGISRHDLRPDIYPLI